jgi:malate dehydrogenase (quinone)
MPLRLRGRAERYGHSFNRNKAVIRRMSVDLSEYLVGQVLQSKRHQFGVLQQFYATANRDEWRLAVAGDRVQIIKPDKDHGGVLEFGAELVGSEDRSLVALLGASPGASTAAFIGLGVLRKCFPDRLTASGWLPKLKEIIPAYGVNLIEDAAACDRIRADTAPVLKIANI